ncbi:hypothetical protein N7463_001283 [Penicillium fimorum]|uniref:Rhodopsin domain-containing protein n=1 Tax=Penicillium fimorum TaxID=1882269 RepID=A0A9W9Y5Y5_9EURO|nr:hypothetical protein N7463_001283 [Penicillium fimorum]
MSGRSIEVPLKKSRYVELLQWEDCQYDNQRSICIISITRLVVMLDSYKTPSVDITWAVIDPSTWTAVETNIGIVSAGRKETTNDDTHKLSSWYGRSSASANSGDQSYYDNQTAGIDVTTSVDIESYKGHNDNMF